MRCVQFFNQKWERLQLKLFNKSINTEDSFGQYYRGKIVPLQGDGAVITIMNELRQVLTKRDVARDSMLWWYTSPNHVGFLAYAFNKLSQLQHRTHFKLIMVLIPFLDDNNADAWERAYQIVAVVAQKYGFDVYNLNNDFKKAGFETLKLDHSDNTHPNKQGHALIAQRLYALLSDPDRKLLPP
jgi:lysophospholipase L1-like esterase